MEQLEEQVLEMGHNKEKKNNNIKIRSPQNKINKIPTTHHPTTNIYFCKGLIFDYLRVKILRENHRELKSAIKVAMRKNKFKTQTGFKRIKYEDNCTEWRQLTDFFEAWFYCVFTKQTIG